MPQVRRGVGASSLQLQCDDPSDEFVIRYTANGEPFRTGIQIGIENKEFDKDLVVMLKDSEAIRVRDLLNQLYPS